MKAGKRYRNWSPGCLSYRKNWSKSCNWKFLQDRHELDCDLLLADSLDTYTRVRASCSSFPRKMRFSLAACEPSVPLASAWHAPASCSHCLACHLAASALQTQLESLSQSPAFWFFLPAGLLSLLWLCFFTWPLTRSADSLVLWFQPSSWPASPLPLRSAKYLPHWPLCRSFLLPDARLLWLPGTNFDCKSISDSTHFTWHQHQTWQIHVPHTQLLTVTHILCWNETNCIRIISELILREGTA